MPGSLWSWHSSGSGAGAPSAAAWLNWLNTGRRVQPSAAHCRLRACAAGPKPSSSRVNLQKVLRRLCAKHGGVPSQPGTVVGGDR